ncbi:hypothetical protein [Cesiribacter andamanensis]|uniref:Penicillin-insensitive murein endopeptidase n=1 Tax=Cesiribacter andamanensis AMV16 TaxID=1279009 RepID=M7NRL9_9BACT|nr:hypothetical protein [Cesiribacter andamanensis]EMR04330.1 hypothetical protein ADICEAN_00493 [Cesiribacter andamanensis AMV16]
MKLLALLAHLLLILLLTALTQIGGLLWLLAYGLSGWGKKPGTGLRLGRSLLLFMGLYTLSALVVLPVAAGYWGKVGLPVWSNERLGPASLLYPLLNRHYVTRPTKWLLQEVADQLHQQQPGAQVRYLDAGFPLFSHFPLLPHLSHTDGRKVDLAFFYQRPDGTPTNETPSHTGYGVFEGPTENEQATAEGCAGKGYWQYSYPRYLTMGQRPSLRFDALRTKKLLQLLVRQPETEKVFLEPHLRERLGFGREEKVRFAGCQAVRHDDHIHVQLR